MSDVKKKNRYSISVAGPTYDRMRAAYPTGSLARFVDEIVDSALDDPSIAARIATVCRREEMLS